MLMIWAILIVLVLMLATSLAIRHGFYHNSLMRVFFVLVLCGLLPLLLQVVVAWPLGEAAGWIAASLWWALTVYGAIFGWRHIVVRTAECASELLPEEFDGYRILQLSDIHIGTFSRSPGVIKKMVDMALAQHADLSLTGVHSGTAAGMVGGVLPFRGKAQIADIQALQQFLHPALQHEEVHFRAIGAQRDDSGLVGGAVGLFQVDAADLVQAGLFIAIVVVAGQDFQHRGQDCGAHDGGVLAQRI